MQILKPGFWEYHRYNYSIILNPKQKQYFERLVEQFLGLWETMFGLNKNKVIALCSETNYLPRSNSILSKKIQSIRL